MGALGSEAADRVSDGHAKKLGKGMSPTNTVGILIYYSPFGILPCQNIHDIFNIIKSTTIL